MNNGVEDTRVVGVADDLHFRDEVSKDNERVGSCDSCDFVLLSEVAGSTFRLGAICVVFDLNILRLRVHGSGDNFSVPVEPDEHGEVFLPLRVLNNFRCLF